MRAWALPNTCIWQMKWLIVTCLLITAAAQTCPGSCNGNGLCDTAASLECRCLDGWTGHNCELRTCPFAKAWVAFSRSATGDVHDQTAECSGAGDCDRTAGICQCRAPFEGDACEKLSCPQSCSNDGRCITLRQAGLDYDGFKMVVGPTNYDKWDADRVQGCKCDVGYQGAACDIRSCPDGDDPLTAGVAEVQQVMCRCPGGCSGGSFRLRLGERSVGILHNAVATLAQEDTSAAPGSGNAAGESVESRVKQLRDWPTMYSVSFAGVETTACSASGTAISLTFLKSAGNMPSILAEAGSLADSGGALVIVSASTTIQGTTERAMCSNRGQCFGGACVCFAGYFPSDGNGNPGFIPDCGSTTNIVNGATSVPAGCPVINCNGNGVCTGSPTYKCNCFTGWQGVACEYRKCPTGPAWYDEPASDGSAHAAAVCSNAGLCDTDTGRCQCYDGYSGTACQRLNCPSAVASTLCSGHGKCLTLREMARDGLFGGEHLGTEEVQTITCGLTAGSFLLSHSNYQSIAIGYAATPAALKAALEALPSIGFVDVRTEPYTALSVCSGAGTVTRVTFLSDLGDQPLLVVDASAGTPTTGLTVVESTKGSRPTYGQDLPGGTQWDAEAITACVCDGYGNGNRTDIIAGDKAHWVGGACQYRACPYGVNPSATVFALKNEVQRLSCSAAGGSLRFTFREHVSANVPSTATAAELKAALELLPTIGVVLIAEVSGWGSGGICGTTGGRAVTDVTFQTELGDLPLLTADGYLLDAPVVSVVEQVKGVGVLSECSKWGKCSTPYDGLCQCEKLWYSSNGLGAPGARGDCGAYEIQGYGKRSEL